MEKPQLVVREVAKNVWIDLILPSARRCVFIMTSRENTLGTIRQLLRRSELIPGAVQLNAPEWAKTELESKGYMGQRGN